MDINKTLMEERIHILSDIPRKEVQTSSNRVMEPLFSISNSIAEEDMAENTVKTEVVHLEDLASNSNNLDREIYDEEGLLADTTISEDISATGGSRQSEGARQSEEDDSDPQDSQLVNKKRQRAVNNTNNKKTYKLSV
jgi:hypothetical protein